MEEGLSHENYFAATMWLLSNYFDLLYHPSNGKRLSRPRYGKPCLGVYHNGCHDKYNRAQPYPIFYIWYIAYYHTIMSMV